MTQTDDGRSEAAATVRRAEKRDYAAVRAFYDSLQNAHARKLPQLFNPAIAEDLTAESFTAALAAADTLVLVAERDGEILAAAQASLLEHAGDGPFRARRWAYVTHIFTQPGARRQGHGKALMQALAAWAHLKGAGSIELYVWDGSDEATAFYRAMGYRTVATHLALATAGPNRTPPADSAISAASNG